MTESSNDEMTLARLLMQFNEVLDQQLRNSRDPLAASNAIEAVLLKIRDRISGSLTFHELRAVNGEIDRFMLGLRCVCKVKVRHDHDQANHSSVWTETTGAVGAIKDTLAPVLKLINSFLEAFNRINGRLVLIVVARATIYLAILQCVLFAPTLGSVSALLVFALCVFDIGLLYFGLRPREEPHKAQELRTSLEIDTAFVKSTTADFCSMVDRQLIELREPTRKQSAETPPLEWIEPVQKLLGYAARSHPDLREFTINLATEVLDASGLESCHFDASNIDPDWFNHTASETAVGLIELRPAIVARDKSRLVIRGEVLVPNSERAPT